MMDARLYGDGLMQERCNSIALAMELRFFLTYWCVIYGPSQYKDVTLFSIVSPFIKIGQSHDCLYFIMEIPIPAKVVFILKWAQTMLVMLGSCLYLTVT